MSKVYISARARVGLGLLASSVVSVLLYAFGAWGGHTRDFAYMIWNLLLAWIALGVSLFLERTLHRNSWSSWLALAATLVWVLFLPNTFYMVTDFIHVRELPETELLSGIFMLSSFIFNGVVLGIISIYIIHRQLQARLSARTSWFLVLFVMLLSSFAMYIGRVLRWNSWDIVVNPFSLLFDVTDRIINAADHPRMLATMLGFFSMITSLYVVAWCLARVTRNHQKPS
jgi:uncharacterized membrane protein